MNSIQKENPLGYEKLPRLLKSFAVPSIIAMLVSSLYNIVDQVFIGQGVGYLGNAATNVAFPLTTISLAIALLIGLLFGIVQGFLVSYLEIQPFIVSLAGMFFGRGMTSIISTDMISIKNKTFLAWANYKIYLPIGSYSRRGKFIPAYIYPTVIIAILIFIVIAIIMKYTKFGREVYAIGGNAQSAMMMGLNVKKTKFKAYVLDGLLAGCGGFLFCLNSCSGFVEQAKGLEMDAISASVIGGTLLSGGVGTPFGTVFGVLIKGTISSLITTQGTLSSWWVRIALSALLCFFIVLQSIIGSMKKKN